MGTDLARNRSQQRDTAASGCWFWVLVLVAGCWLWVRFPGFLSLFSFLRAFLLTAIKRNQAAATQPRRKQANRAGNSQHTKFFTSKVRQSIF